MKYCIAEQFTRYPGPRYEKQGPYSGQKFLNDVLIPNIERGEDITIDLDGTVGYGPSFLDEAFGGLIREGTLTFEEFTKRIDFISSRDYITKEIMAYARNASRSMH